VILTVTCNPALDVTHRVGRLEPGAVHRVRAAHARPGGKGVNVAWVLHQLGEHVFAVGLADADFADAVEASGLPSRFLPALDATRRTVAVVEDDGRTTSLWEPGGSATPSAADDLAALVDELLAEASVLVVSGSLPPGVPDDLPAQLARLAAARGAPAVLDVDGAALHRAADSASGAVLVPNHAELAGLLPGDPVEAAHALAASTGSPVLVTLGSAGAVAVTADGSWCARPPEQVVGNPTGAGDAVAAAVARGVATGRPWTEILADAVALGAAAVRAPVAGEVDVAAYARWRDAVEVTGR
jgi:tagatose 6-phosphate kinase